MKVEPVTLEGEFVRLEPLRVDHLPAFCRVGLDESLWRWTANIVKAEGDLERYVRSALSDQALGLSLPFVTIERSGETVVGSTRLAAWTPQTGRRRSAGPGSLRRGKERRLTPRQSC